MVKPLKSVAMEQRERALVATEYNVFAFPADLLTVDLLSDSGTTTMTTLQWAALIHGDESYGRNTGYYRCSGLFLELYATFWRSNWLSSQ
jgi:tryptophanase